MEQVLIDIRKESHWIKSKFKNKDFITLKDLMDTLENLICDNDTLEEEKKDLENKLINGCDDEPDPYQELMDRRLTGDL